MGVRSRLWMVAGGNEFGRDRGELVSDVALRVGMEWGILDYLAQQLDLTIPAPFRYPQRAMTLHEH